MRAYSLAASRLLQRAVAFDGVCVLTLDPATLLPTGEIVEHGLPPEATLRMAAIEVRGGDVNAFSALARAETPAASLSEATGGDLDRSARHRELRAPNGFGDELRSVLAEDGATWGALTLLRRDDHEPFAPADTALVASVSRLLAEGLRRALLLAEPDGGGEAEEGSVGLVLLEPDDAVAIADAAAERWLAELRADPADATAPPVVRAVAARARGIAAGRACALARARVRTAYGTWLVVRGSTLGDGADARTAVIVEPARPHDLAPLRADAFELTPRECAVTQLVAYGLPTTPSRAACTCRPGPCRTTSSRSSRRSA